MRLTNAWIALLLVTNVTCASTSIYGSAFDYKKVKPARDYFSDKTAEQIASYCKRGMLGVMDLSACAEFRYEMIADVLSKRISVVEEAIKEGDKANAEYGGPAALPFFKKGQANWERYRDNICYSNVYSVGQASLRFVDFWDCMARITKNRLDELTKPDVDD
ncbi:lysozyme inhibitor LprI family protein [Paraburkholderia hiiakae]|uniref:lysozyme inhibitor LprI family protein n=1 Tax=Paraburkholderia hiiakae TaxID=1081782 RepID=UPI00191B8425|nr:lysozyme inhibitor LprI family protein [Paraburkholderia hiiakae]